MYVIVCHKWSRAGYRSHFKAEHVNKLERMLQKHTTLDFKLVCFTDDPKGINCETHPSFTEFAKIPSPMANKKNPACFRRLSIFKKSMGEFLGASRIIQMDLDVVITNNIDHILDRKEDFIMWGDTAKSTPYNGSLLNMVPGARECVYNEFDPDTSIQRIRQSGFIGSDQAWIGVCLGQNEAKFSSKDGVYSFRNHFELNKPPRKELPSNACMVIFHGNRDPWHTQLYNTYSWIKEHYEKI